MAINYPPDDRSAAEETATLVQGAGGAPILAEADVADPDAVRRMDSALAQNHGIVDVLVNNAGICPFREFFDIDVELWDRVQSVNLRGVFLVTQAITRRMVSAKRGGRVIAVSSISAVTGGLLQSHYCPTKAGVSALMKSLALILGPKGITCNSVLPGVIATDINAADLARPGRQEFFAQRIPLGLGRPEDVARVITLVASADSSYINGADIVCDGGLLVNPGT